MEKDAIGHEIGTQTMKLFRLKYWDSEHPDELYFINIDAIISIHSYTHHNRYVLEIGVGMKVLGHDYAHELNRDNDMGQLIDACNALNSPNNPDPLDIYGTLLERMP